MLAFIVSISTILFILSAVFSETILTKSNNLRLSNKDKTIDAILGVLLLASIILTLLNPMFVFSFIVVTIILIWFKVRLIIKIVKSKVVSKFDVLSFDFIFINVISFLWIPIFVLYSFDQISNLTQILIFNNFSIFNVIFTYLSGVLVMLAFYIYVYLFIAQLMINTSSNRMTDKFGTLKAHLIVIIIAMIIMLFILAEVGIGLNERNLYLFDKLYSTLETIILSLIVPTIYTVLQDKNNPN